MTIRGTLEKKETNTYGYTTVWISKTRYGADKKGPIPAEAGDQVEFEAFDKPGKDGRAWPTIQLATFRKAAATESRAGTLGGNSSAERGLRPNATELGNSVAGSAVLRPTTNISGGRDSYWADKATEDAKKDPRIVFQSSYERALLFAKLAIDTKCFEALEKAKPTARLEVLTAFVDEQAARIFKAVYAAEVPEVEEKAAVAGAAAELEPLLEQEWS